MSRFHPSIEGIIPKEERIRVYSEAISFYTEKKSGYGGDWSDLGLCLLLPCIFFNCGYSDTMDGYMFLYRYTDVVFSEIKEYVEQIICFSHSESSLDKINELRIYCLTQCLEEAKNASE